MNHAQLLRNASKIYNFLKVKIKKQSSNPPTKPFGIACNEYM